MAALWQAAQNSAGLVERAHDGFGVAVEVGEDLGVGDGAGDGRAGFIDQHGRDAHDVAAGAGGVCGLDGVADRAGHALLLEGALLRHSLRQVAGEQRDRVVAALAVARVLHALFVDEGIHIFQVPGGAEAVRVHRLRHWW
jgi:hypothetical protein